MVGRAVSEKCQACHCVITEFRLVWEQWCANAEVFQNPTLLIWCSRHPCYFKDTLKISTGINDQWFNKVKVVLRLSVLCDLEWWYGLGDRELSRMSSLGKDPLLLVWLKLEACFIPAQPCNSCLHHAQDTHDAPHPQRAALWATGQVCFECVLEREVCVDMWKEHGLCSLDLPLANATGLNCPGPVVGKGRWWCSRRRICLDISGLISTCAGERKE